MQWFVYNFNINAQKIEVYNVFKHWSFRECAKSAIRKFKTKEEFAKRLKVELMYYFWSKCEWELVVEITADNRIFINPWVGCREPEKVRIDVTEDIGFDWRGFAEKHTRRQIHGNQAKIDVYDQVDYRWEEFVNYCWNNKKELLKMKD